MRSPVLRPKALPWNCSRCGKLLGVFRGPRLHIQFARGHDYLVSTPATVTCRGCHSLNEAPQEPTETSRIL